ncbi:MAG: LysE family transporter [Anaerolineae bacterium]|nr:LysE family transporter [Anaerolineae bacterium]
MIELLTSGAGFGFTAGSMIGPLQTYLINETLLKGWQRSVIIAFSPLFTDAPIIFLMVVVLNQLPENAIGLLQIVGGFYILTLVRPTWKQSQQPPDLNDAVQAGSQRQTLGRAMMINWLNPGPYLFWGTVLGPLLVGGLEKSVLHGLMLMLGFYGAFIGVMLGLTILFTRLRYLDKRYVGYMMRLTVLILLFFGIRLVLQGIDKLL